MSISAPTVMVSSTYYDLRQVRANLSEFISGLGYRPLLSEEPSFPVDPDIDTIENCRRRVERDADILVLVIGGRYGAVPAGSQKSITNLEYLTARSKGIPVIAFVESKVVHLLPIWKQNPTAEFGPDVPDPRLFGFVETVRSVDRVWTREFENAQGIVDALRLHFAHLMKEGLEASRMFRTAGFGLPASLRGRALRLALERPDLWEFRLFGQVLTDELEKHKEMRMEQRLGLAFGGVEHVGFDQLEAWGLSRIEEVRRLVGNLSDLVNVHLNHALRPPGVPADIGELVFVAQKMGEAYRSLIQWSQKVRCAHVPSCFGPVVREMSVITEQTLETIEEKSAEYVTIFEDAAQLPADKRPSEFSLSMVLKIRNEEALSAAMAQAATDCVEQLRREMAGEEE